MDPSLSPADEGKEVIDADGAFVGTVEEVEDGVSYVDPIPDLDALVEIALSWTDEADRYPLRAHRIDTITDSTIYLCSNL